MQNEILTPRDLFDNVDYYRNMRMSFDRNGGGNVWRYKHAENSIHVQSNMVAQKYKNGKPPSARNSDSQAPKWTSSDGWTSS